MTTAHIVIGLGFGDEGKGKSVDFLTTKYSSKLNFRFNGGSQAYHNVFNGKYHHAFRQIGSGSFNEQVRTILGPKMLIDPLALELEAEDFNSKVGGNVLSRIYLARDALMITPYHQAVNRLRELARKNRHGSVGKGIGEVRHTELNFPTLVQPRIHTAINKEKLHERLKELQNHLMSEAAWLESKLDKKDEAVHQEQHRLTYCPEIMAEQISDIVSRCTIVDPFKMGAMIHAEEHVVFEGSQGMLLDQDYGFAPHTTWSNMRSTWAIDELPTAARAITYGVIRTLTTRHGAGPLPTEDATLQKHFADNGNPANAWQGDMRYGWLDLNLLRYALEINPVDSLIVNHWDLLQPRMKVCTRYDNCTLPWKLKKIKSNDESRTTAINNVIPVYAEVTNETEFQNLIEAAAGVAIVYKGIGQNSSAMR